MDAYAALVSLMHVLMRIKTHSCPIPFADESQLDDLNNSVCDLVDVLEDYSRKIIEGLNTQIVEAARAAEDMIESYIVEKILPRRESFGRDVRLIADKVLPRVQGDATYHKLAATSLGKKLREPLQLCARYVERHFGNFNVIVRSDLQKWESYHKFRLDLEEAIKNMESIREQVRTIKEKESKNDNLPVLSTSLSSSMPSNSNTTMVGFDKELNDLKEKLIPITNTSSLQIIPVVGMGGIGKTTLARSVYKDPCIGHHFHFKIFVTISQHYIVEEILLGILCEIGIHEMSYTGKERLGEQLYKHLIGRRYLIILDDVWSTKVWYEIRKIFPKNKDGSIILFTTRSLKVARKVGSCDPYEMKLLDKAKSWKLLSSKIFGEEACPPELMELGEKIAECCQGLPLAIVVIGGLLKKSEKTSRYWETVSQNVPSTVVKNNEDCLKILSLSYDHLPIHLKPCFLYMATCPEDFVINISRLIKLWCAEGLIRPKTDRDLEDVALEYLNDLVDRNLVMVAERGSSGKMKFYRIHELLRSLSLIEAKKNNFFRLIEKNTFELKEKMSTHRRFFLNQSCREVVPPFATTSLARSLLCNLWSSPLLTEEHLRNSRAHAYSLLDYELIDWVPEKWLRDDCRLLRVLDAFRGCSVKNMMQLINLRYMAFSVAGERDRDFITSSISSFWNLETLIVRGIYWNATVPSEIWMMPNLKHLLFSPNVIFPKPIGNLKNLKTLSTVKNFSFDTEVLSRIPNVTKLGIYYDLNENDVKLSNCFGNLVDWDKIEALKCVFSSPPHICVIDELNNLTFSPNIIKLTLSGCRLSWKNMSIVGSLCNLEVLKLRNNAFGGRKWNLVEGEFQKLKFLLIEGCDLVDWMAEYTHFPNLIHLYLYQIQRLEKIPEYFGEVPTLESIRMESCPMCAVRSAKEVLKIQKFYGYDDLIVQVRVPLNSDEEADARTLEEKDGRFKVVTGKFT